MDRRAEQEYKQVLDSLRYSSEGKERIMKNLMERQKQRPEKRKSIRPLRAVLVAAAVWGALVMTAGAANVFAYQAKVRFFDNQEEMIEAQLEKQDPNGPVSFIGGGGPNGMDYDELTDLDMEIWWEGPGGELVEDVTGTEEDGWTAKRVFRYMKDNKVCLEARYRAQQASGFDGLWVGLDTSYLEEHYTVDPDELTFRTVTANGEPYCTGLVAEYRGDGDTVFNFGYSRDERQLSEDVYRLSSRYDYAGYYTTKDGVETAIEMATSHTGKSLFWVSFFSGHNSFSMHGTQVELDEIHNILDSLNLSALLEYAPE